MTGVRVLHVLDSFELGGAQRVALQLADWATAHGCEVTLVGRDGPVRDQVGARVRTVRTDDGGFAAELAQLFRLVRQLRPQVLHAHQRREALLCAVVGGVLRVPTVEHAHTLLPDRGMRALSFRSRRVFAVSEQVRRMVTEDFRRPPTLTVTVGNTAGVRPAGPPVPRRSPDGVLRLVGLGRLTEQKDPLRFVRVVATVAGRTPVRADWYGEGPLLERARRLADELGAPVTFHGPTEDVVAALDASDALLMTSAWEGMPLVVLEAFLRHRTVVATAACGSPGALDDGRAVVVPDDASDDEFAQALLGALDDDRVTAARTTAAAAWLDANASPEAVFGPVLATYEAMAR